MLASFHVSIVGFLSLSPEADWVFTPRTGAVCIETPWEQDQMGVLVHIPKPSSCLKAQCCPSATLGPHGSLSPGYPLSGLFLSVFGFLLAFKPQPGFQDCAEP